MAAPIVTEPIVETVMDSKPIVETVVDTKAAVVETLVDTKSPIEAKATTVTEVALEEVEQTKPKNIERIRAAFHGLAGKWEHPIREGEFKYRTPTGPADYEFLIEERHGPAPELAKPGDTIEWLKFIIRFHEDKACQTIWIADDEGNPVQHYYTLDFSESDELAQGPTEVVARRYNIKPGCEWMPHRIYRFWVLEDGKVDNFQIEIEGEEPRLFSRY